MTWRVFALVNYCWLTSLEDLDHVALAFWLMSWRTLLHLEGLLYLEDFAMLGWCLAIFGGDICWLMLWRLCSTRVWHLEAKSMMC